STLLRTNDDRAWCTARRCQFQLFAHAGVAQPVLDRDAPLPQRVGELQNRRQVVAADRDQKGAEFARRLGGHAALLEELAEYNVAHAEPQGGLIQQPVVTSTA